VRWNKVRAVDPVYRPCKQIAAAPFWRFSATCGHDTPAVKRRGSVLPGIGRGTGSIAVALVAAWLLVLQSALGAFALGTGPQAAQFDAFGNVICTHDGAGELPAGDPHEQRMPPCCTFGCILSGATVNAPPATLAISRPVVFEAISFAVPSPVPALFPRERTAANPRAPPLAA
jgi:hypothetical protein